MFMKRRCMLIHWNYCISYFLPIRDSGGQGDNYCYYVGWGRGCWLDLMILYINSYTVHKQHTIMWRSLHAILIFQLIPSYMLTTHNQLQGWGGINSPGVLIKTPLPAWPELGKQQSTKSCTVIVCSRHGDFRVVIYRWCGTRSMGVPNPCDNGI